LFLECACENGPSDKWIRYLYVCVIEESSTVGPQINVHIVLWIKTKESLLASRIAINLR
jgi:hypothetical protein